MDTLSHDGLTKKLRGVFDDAEEACPQTWSRAALATTSRMGPELRYVLLKDFDSRGLTFYTNYDSAKARQLARSPRASLGLHWWETGVQVRTQGIVCRVSVDESDAYFASRDRLSQIGAWASRQSRSVISPLRERVAAVERRFPGEIPRPPFWGGYRLRPERVELWFDREGRLHERHLYERVAAGWRSRRLDP